MIQLKTGLTTEMIANGRLIDELDLDSQKSLQTNFPRLDVMSPTLAPLLDAFSFFYIKRPKYCLNMAPISNQDLNATRLHKTSDFSVLLRASGSVTLC